ncbi:enoyl-CoA hydratase, partial [Amaricoccus sp. HAR-UPW-R2A-40]
MSGLHLLIDGAIAELRLDNAGKLNALTTHMLEELDSHCGALERDPEIRAVILTAEGDRAFCAGADIVAWGALSAADFSRHWVREGHRIFGPLARLSKPDRRRDL